MNELSIESVFNEARFLVQTAKSIWIYIRMRDEWNNFSCSLNDNSNGVQLNRASWLHPATCLHIQIHRHITPHSCSVTSSHRQNMLQSINFTWLYCSQKKLQFSAG